MKIEDLYINSDRLTANISLEHKRYLYNEINWESRMVCIRGARGGREDNIAQTVSQRNHEATFSRNGDFLIDGKFTFEVGGKNKTFDQIKDLPNSYLALDGIKTGFEAKIPLWLFGFIE